MPTPCQIVSGFLIKHPCDYPAVGKCIYCKKRVCEHHTRQVAGTIPPPSQAADTAEATASVICVECAKQQSPDSTHWRSDPYFYGTYYHSHYAPYSVYDSYDEADHAVFDRTGTEGGAFEGDLMGT